MGKIGSAIKAIIDDWRRLPDQVDAANRRNRDMEAILQSDKMRTSNILMDVVEELAKAQIAHEPMHSAHEGWAVIREEMDELWDEVRKRDRSPRTIKRMRREAVQIAAMAVRFVADVCDKEED